MANFLDLCNKVLLEAGVEQDLLTLANWTDIEEGRNIYPRVKRLVAEAWKLIQMERMGWEFKTASMSTTLYPRIKVVDGYSPLGAPAAGTVFRGQDSEFELTVRQTLTEDGDWTVGTAVGQIEFDNNELGNRLLDGELFEEVSPNPGDAFFTHIQKGYYDFKEVDPELRDIHWSTFVASKNTYTPIPVTYIPWDNWLYREISFVYGTRTVPTYLSQDPHGNVVFYPQTLDPFRINFIYTKGPQILSDPEDVPVELEEEYHDWIAWYAVANLARFDKNMDLLNYATSMAAFYKGKAESDLMPIPSWGYSRYNRGGVI